MPRDPQYPKEPEPIASWGEAKLFRIGYTDRYRLVGGTDPDRAEAAKWCKMFNYAVEGLPPEAGE